MNEEQAKELGATKWWEKANKHEVVKFQLFEDMLCMPFELFHEAVEAVLGRSVWTHEFASPHHKELQAEFNGKKDMPNMREIMELLPAEKTIIVEASDE